MDGEKEKPSLAIPGAIVLAGVLVAGAIFMTNQNPSTDNTATANNAAPADISVAPITDEDHVRGNPDADIFIVEYSDTECPFCKQFHSTLQQVMAEYGRDGKVAWVYRHFPIEQLHAKALKEAEALECAAELGGNEIFWEYTDRLYEITPSNDGLDASQLPEIAVHVGLNRASFEECLNSGRMADEVQADLEDAGRAGGRGTPHSVLVVNGEAVAPIVGAQPYASVKSLIDQVLAEQ